MCDHHGHGDAGHVCAGPTGVSQTLDEMEFERGLWGAAKEGDVSKLQALLTKRDPANPNQPDQAGYLPIHYAARSGHLQCVKALLDGGANVNAETRAGKATALHRAAYMGYLDVSQLLISRRADVNAQDADGCTPLHKATHSNDPGHRSVVQALLAANARIDLRDNHGRLALGEQTGH